MKKLISLTLCVVFVLSLAFSFLIPASALSVTDVLGLIYCSSGNEIKSASHCFSFRTAEKHYILSVIPVEGDYSYSCIFHDLSGTAQVNYDGSYFTVLTMRKKGLTGTEISEETVACGDSVFVCYYDVENYEDASSLTEDNLIKKPVEITAADNGLYEISQELDAAAEGGLVVDTEGTFIGIVANSQSMNHVIGFSYVINEILKNNSTGEDTTENVAGWSDGGRSHHQDKNKNRTDLLFWIIFGVVLLVFIALAVFFVVRRIGKKKGSQGNILPPSPDNFGGDQHIATPSSNNFANLNMPTPSPNNFGSQHIQMPGPGNISSLNLPTTITSNLNGGKHIQAPHPVNPGDEQHIQTPHPVNPGNGQYVQTPHPVNPGDNQHIQTPSSNHFDSLNMPTPPPVNPDENRHIQTPHFEDFSDDRNIQPLHFDDFSDDRNIQSPHFDDFSDDRDIQSLHFDDFSDDRNIQTPPTDNSDGAQNTYAGNICLRGVGGYFDGQEFRLTDTVTIGRKHSRCDICYPADYGGISSLHCQLRRVDSHLEITDLASSYGTFVNGIKLSPNDPVNLSVGDTFWLAKQRNSFIVHE